MQRATILTLVLLAAVVPTRAADKPKPAQLTSKEIAEGWILLFDGESLFGWQAAEGDKWSIVDGLLSPQAGTKGVLRTTTEFGNYELRFEYQAKRDGQAQILVACNANAKPFPIKENAPLPPEVEVMPLRVLGSGWVSASHIVKAGKIVSTSLSSTGGGQGSASSVVTDTVRRGHIAFAGNGLVLRNIKLKPLDTKSLFNGKDLTGWKKFETEAARAKSKFTVTPEGWLNVKDGPGDLQTEGQWADFVLQFDGISHGKHLNSGLFFRCRPGEYQQGYEAQIRNEFKDTPQDYTVEEYDPKTNALTGKKKVQSPAVDFGTGAIYRRQPARRQASQDNEWFTMTVVAHGRHLATWVNGVQVADWTDHRPLKDNARNGCYLEKGPVSIQGHDPTTNLSFRNFRVAELTK